MNTKKNPAPNTSPEEKTPGIMDDFLFLSGMLLAVLGIAIFGIDLILGYPLLLTTSLVFWPLSLAMFVVCLLTLVKSFARKDRHWRLARLTILLMLVLMIVDVASINLNMF